MGRICRATRELFYSQRYYRRRKAEGYSSSRNVNDIQLDSKSLIESRTTKESHDMHARYREFKVGDSVYAKNYRDGPQWLPGEVIQLHGSVMYTIALK